MKFAKQAVSFITVALLAGTASAYETGDMILRVGTAHVSPDAESSELVLAGSAVADSSANVHTDTQLGITGVYMLREHLGLELLASTPFEHDITAATGALGLGRVDAGSAKHLPPTLSLQYYPADPQSPWQPYVGIGVNYTLFFSENVSNTLTGVLGAGSLDLDNSLGLALQAGIDYEFNDRLLANFSIWSLDIDTTANFDFGGTTLTTDVDIDPIAYKFSIGYRF